MLAWESHVCLPLHARADFAPLRRLRDHGVHYASVNVGMDLNPLPQIMTVLAAFRAAIFRDPANFILAEGVNDVVRAKKSGRLAIGFDMEGAKPLLGRPEMLVLFRDLGVRQIHFAYNRNNEVAGGCHDRPRGLTALGGRMVKAVNDAGMLMDCSHTGRRCSMEIMALSRHPVVFSHANPLALIKHGRNITDGQIRAAAETGGVVCVSGVSAFVGNPRPTVDDVARHAAYVSELVGPEHAGIGLDISFRQKNLDDSPPPPFDPNYWWPLAAGYNRALRKMSYVPADAWRNLPAALRRVGMNKNEIAGVMGGNMARVAARVWGDARKT